ncbi:unnamed protein product [Phaedon cochleariae]|uniref:Ubiquitin-like protease family profile domain-containing protein n=1 Tax=Phaedon cochleariae TaxID=80249 RepID=A0A9N9SJA5_PHACE|nr:unnamed protein product [Phaedon cochleariae]
MDNIRAAVEYVRNLLAPVLPERNRKRRALDPLETLISPKFRRFSDMSKDFIDLDDERFFLNPRPSKRSPSFKTPPSRLGSGHIDTVILDDEDDDLIEIRPVLTCNQSRPIYTKFTSTPENNTHKSSVNGTSNSDDIVFVREMKNLNSKKVESPKLGSGYKPFCGNSFKFKSLQNYGRPKEKPTTNGSFPEKNNTSRSSLNYSIRLDDKMNYQRLIDSAAGSSPLDRSVYSTPLGKYFDTFDTSSRAGRILNMTKKSPVNDDTNKERLLTRDAIKKVLHKFEGDTVVLKDSDSDSDVILVNPPTPKPDFEVEPVNSLKKIVDTSQQTDPGWLTDLSFPNGKKHNRTSFIFSGHKLAKKLRTHRVQKHRIAVQQRQTEIDLYRKCSEKHSKINKDMRMDILTDKVNKALLLKDAVLPVEEIEEEVDLPPLTDAHHKMVEKAFRGDPNEILARKFNLNITRRDLLTLAGLNWLNDEVINFYMNLIIERGKDSKWPKSYAFNTFFYSKLIKDGPQSLRRWTKRVDLFSHDLVCVPIHLGMHWCMAIIDFRDKSIRYYDSMGGNNNKCLSALRNYLEAEHLDKKKSAYSTSDFTLENVKDIPQQMNGSDCGMFSCTFAEFITRNSKINFTQEHMPYLRKKMVVEIMSGEFLIQ